MRRRASRMRKRVFTHRDDLRHRGPRAHTAGLSAIGRDLLDVIDDRRTISCAAAPVITWTAVGVFFRASTC